MAQQTRRRLESAASAAHVGQMATMADLDVLTIGSVMAEVSPPEHSVRVTEAPHLVMTQAGSATTFAIAFARLGGRLGLISRTGDDEIGSWIVRSLGEHGVDTSLVRPVPGQLTPLSLASVDAYGHKTFAYYRFPGTCEPLATLRAEEISDEQLQRARVFDLTESVLRNPQSREVALTLAARARALGLSVCVNPNYRPTAWPGGAPEARRVLTDALQQADLAIMNAEEALLITGAEGIPAAIHAMHAWGIRVVAITQGDRAVYVGEPSTITAIEVPAVDVTFDIGAGDTFHAGFLVRWCAGDPPQQCAQFGIAAASLKIQRPPAIEFLPTADEVAQLLDTGLLH